MESIKKQSLPSNPTANAAPAPSSDLRLRPPAIPSMSAPGRHLCGAVSHVGTLQAIRRVTTASPHLQHIFQLQPGTAGGPLSLPLTLSLALPLSLLLSEPKLTSLPSLSWPLRLGPSNQCPVAGLNPRIDDYIILYYKFLIEYISSITPLGKIYLLSLQRATVKGFIHTQHTHIHTSAQSKQSQP